MAASPLIPNRLLTDLAFSCRTDELLVAMSSTTVGAIHTEVGAVQILEGALSPPAIFTTERFTNDDTILAVTPDGRLLVSPPALLGLPHGNYRLKVWGRGRDLVGKRERGGGGEGIGDGTPP